MIDFRQTYNGDIDLTGGDIHYVESTVAHQRDLLLTGMGELKHSPTSGVGIIDFLNNETPEAMLRTVRRKFIQDGMTVKSVKQNAAGELEVDAFYDIYPVVPHFAKDELSGFTFLFPIVLGKAGGEFPMVFSFPLGKEICDFPLSFPLEFGKNGYELPLTIPFELP